MVYHKVHLYIYIYIYIYTVTYIDSHLITDFGHVSWPVTGGK